MEKGILYQAFVNAGFGEEARTLRSTTNKESKIELGREILTYENWRFGKGDKLPGYQSLCKIVEFILTKCKDIRTKTNLSINTQEDILNSFLNKYSTPQT